MSLSAFFSSTISVASISTFSPNTIAYKQRVEADGGIIYSLNAVNEAYSKASSWAVNPAATHWSSPQFGYKLDGIGNVIKRYCLFGSDAVPQIANTSWTLVPSATKAPQMLARANNGFVIPAFTWQDRNLTSVTTATQNSYSTTAGYPFFPLVELSPNWNSYSAFLVGIDINGGYNLGGWSSNPYCYAATESTQQLNTLQSYVLAIDTTQTTYQNQLRFSLNSQQTTSYPYQSLLQAGSSYSASEVYLGVRGDSNQYYWAGNINDVFFTNKVLTSDAITWLENQKDKY
jgi:hypothetical protein